MKLTFRLKGGSGSGHYGHSGRPGKKGGSLPGTSSVGSIKRFDTVTGLQDKYSTTKFKVSSSVEGGRQRRYITRIPRAEIEQHLLGEGYQRVKGAKYTYTHPAGVSARMSTKSGKYKGAYYVYMDIAD